MPQYAKLRLSDGNSLATSLVSVLRPPVTAQLPASRGVHVKRYQPPLD